MKAILLTNEPEKVSAVYTKEIINNLIFEAGLFPQIFSKEDLLKDPAYFADVEYVFSTWGIVHMSEEQLALCLPKLKAFFYAAGSVQYFARPIMARGARIYSAWRQNAIAVAEAAFAEILLANKGLYQLRERMKSPEGYKAVAAAPAQYTGNYKTEVGILGAGQIGRHVIKLLHPYNLTVKVYDPYYTDTMAAEDGTVKASLEEIFETCQTISNHMANNEATQKILNYSLFSRMKPTATFINTGRGAQVVEDDLIRALNEEPWRTALLDVTDPEPPVEGSPLYTMPNVYLTPHRVGGCGKEIYRMSECIYSEFKKYLAGVTDSENEVTAKMLETMA